MGARAGDRQGSEQGRGTGRMGKQGWAGFRCNKMAACLCVGRAAWPLMTAKLNSLRNGASLFQYLLGDYSLSFFSRFPSFSASPASYRLFSISLFFLVWKEEERGRETDTQESGCVEILSFDIKGEVILSSVGYRLLGPRNDLKFHDKGVRAAILRNGKKLERPR